MDRATLIVQFNFCDYVLQKIVDGLAEGDWLHRPSPAGNCANWVLGHVVSTRNSAMPLVGREPLYPAEKFARYKRGTPPLNDVGEAEPHKELVRAYDKLHAAFMEGLKQITPEHLRRKAPFSPTNNPDETNGSLLAGIAFHEAYHIGQTGILRRMAGKAGAVG